MLAFKFFSAAKFLFHSWNTYRRFRCVDNPVMRTSIDISPSARVDVFRPAGVDVPRTAAGVDVPPSPGVFVLVARAVHVLPSSAGVAVLPAVLLGYSWVLLSPVGGGGIDVVPAGEELPLVELAGSGGGEAVPVDVPTLLYNPDRQYPTQRQK